MPALDTLQYDVCCARKVSGFFSTESRNCVGTRPTATDDSYMAGTGATDGPSCRKFFPAWTPLPCARVFAPM